MRPPRVLREFYIFQSTPSSPLFNHLLLYSVSSASSAATVSTTETGPIGFTPSPTSASGSSSSSSAAGSKVNLMGGSLNGVGAAGIFSVASMILGATLVL